MRCFRLHNNALFAKNKLIHVAVICNINALELVNGICKHSHTKRVIFIGVRDIQPVNDKLRLVAPCVYNRRDCFKALYTGQWHFIRIIQMVLNVVLAAVQPVNLNVCVLCIVNLFCGGKRTLPDDSIVPCQGINVRRADIVDTNAPRISNFGSVRIDEHSLNDRNIRYRSKRCLSLLRFVRLDLPVVFRENRVYELLLLLPLERDVYPLVHQKVCPVLAYLFRHAYGISVAFQFFNAIPYRVTVEVLDIPFVPVSPHSDQLVEIKINGIESQLL